MRIMTMIWSICMAGGRVMSMSMITDILTITGMMITTTRIPMITTIHMSIPMSMITTTCIRTIMSLSISMSTITAIPMTTTMSIPMIIPIRTGVWGKFWISYTAQT